MIFLDAVRGRGRSAKSSDQKNDCLYEHCGWATAIDSYSVYTPERMIDRNESTQWVSGTWCGSHPWCRINLGSPHSICRIRFVQAASSDIASAMTLAGSNNDSTYTTVSDVTGLGANENILTFPVNVYQYWKFTHVSGGTYGWQICTIQLYGPVE